MSWSLSVLCVLLYPVLLSMSCRNGVSDGFYCKGYQENEYAIGPDMWMEMGMDIYGSAVFLCL